MKRGVVQQTRDSSSHHKNQTKLWPAFSALSDGLKARTSALVATPRAVTGHVLKR